MAQEDEKQFKIFHDDNREQSRKRGKAGREKILNGSSAWQPVPDFLGSKSKIGKPGTREATFV